MPPPPPPRGYRLARTVAWLLVTFLVLFPKGGLKLAGAPLTWGYILLAATALPLLFWRLFTMPLRIDRLAAAALGACLPFQLLLLYSLKANGYDTLAYAIALVTNFCVLPWLFLFLYPAFFASLDRQRFSRHLCACVFWAAAFGIFLFFWRPLTGSLLEVPLLTVNLADYGQIELTKHIARGGFLKLISTYNNGNVYGVATLLLLPLYTRLETRRYRRLTVRLALVLTLSRTVWAGLVAEQLLSFLPSALATAQTFPRLQLFGTGKRLLLLAGTAVCILGALFASSYSLAFLFDPTLGGRLGEVSVVSQATLLPTRPITGFAEVLFASAFYLYGFAGFVTLLLLFVFPLLLVIVRPELLRDPARRAAAKGLLLYLIVSASDGATNLIPVMAFYWFIYSVLLCGLPGAAPAPLRRAAPAQAPLPMPAAEPQGWEGAPSRA